MYLLAKANCVKSRAWEVHKMKEKNALIARRQKSSLSVVNTAERERETILCNFQSLYCLGSRFVRLSEKNTLHILYKLRRRWRSKKGRETNVISILLARQKLCTRKFCRRFLFTWNVVALL